MPKRCIPCLAAEIKLIIKEAIKDPELHELLDGIEDCEENELIRLCGTEKRRKPSEYQSFISSCMKSKKIKGFGEASGAMRECARTWRERKK